MSRPEAEFWRWFLSSSDAMARFCADTSCDAIYVGDRLHYAYDFKS